MVAIAAFGALSRELALPAVPADLRAPAERAAYITRHFWDSMDWTDSAAVADERFMEQNCANFYSVLPLVDSIAASDAVGEMLRGASVNRRAYESLARIAELYLYDVESPMVSEELYLVVTDRLMADRLLDDASLLRIDDVRQAMLRNRVGHRATDFEFITRQGTTMTLADAVEESRRTVLLFYDPDCHDCMMAEQQLMEAAPADTRVVMIYPYGSPDGDEWAAHAAQMPASWIVGYVADEDFDGDRVYDIRVTPTVYVIDRDMTVVSKTYGSLPGVGEDGR